MLRIDAEPESFLVLLQKSSLDGVISFWDIEDKSNLVAYKLEDIVEDVSQPIRIFYSNFIKIFGSIPEGAVWYEPDWSQ